MCQEYKRVWIDGSRGRGKENEQTDEQTESRIGNQRGTCLLDERKNPPTREIASGHLHVFSIRLRSFGYELNARNEGREVEGRIRGKNKECILKRMIL